MMKHRKRVLILIDQATRDGVSQLLIAHYLRRHGVTVTLANQATFVPLCEAMKPDLVYVSWVPGGGFADYLSLPRMRSRVRVVLVDQEGARIGEEPFKRTFRVRGGAKAQFGRLAQKICVWGTWQAQWLLELGIVREEQLVITGCPKLDPYTLSWQRSPSVDRYVGCTFRYERLTSQPERVMEHIFEYLEGFPSMGYPEWAQHEDRLWHAAAVARHMFKFMTAISERLTVRMVVRPGPWERVRLYDFLPQQLARVSVDSRSLQHEYVRNAAVLLDECSTLGLEALIAGVPVVSVQRMVPRLEEHIGGQGGGYYHAPFLAFYWKPRSINEGMNLVEQALHGQLAATADPQGFDAYLRGMLDWPTQRPAAFRVGDVLLEQLELPPAVEPQAGVCEEPQDQRVRRAVFRAVPGATVIPRARFWWSCVRSPQRDLLLRYHYFRTTYPHYQTVRQLFQLLQAGAMQPTTPDLATKGVHAEAVAS